MSKRQEPQTAAGLATVIAAVLGVYGRSECRASECKQALNHLVRAYGDRFLHRKPAFISSEAANAAPGTHLYKDHVVPVRVLMRYLMDCARSADGITPRTIQEFLSEFSCTCYITTGEDTRLRQFKFAHAMPDGSVCSKSGLPLKKWARYMAPSVQIAWQEFVGFEQEVTLRKIRKSHRVGQIAIARAAA